MVEPMGELTVELILHAPTQEPHDDEQPTSPAAEPGASRHRGQMVPGRAGIASKTASRLSAFAPNSSIMSPGWNMPACQPAM